MHPRHNLKTGLAAVVLALLLVLSTSPSSANTIGEEMVVSVHDEDMSVIRYPAQGDDLLIFFRSGGGSSDRIENLARGLAARGIETWTIDLAESLFLPGGVSTLRGLDGRYVAGLISEAHTLTGKPVTLMSYGYGSLPLLRGIRVLQSDTGRTIDINRQVNGAVLISPELYSTIPDLGLNPVYDPISRATNTPVMLYQGGTAGNRWQLAALMEQLQSGGAEVYTSIMQDVTGLFYDEDVSPATQHRLNELPATVAGAISRLKSLSVPSQPADMAEYAGQAGTPLDTTLTPFKGNPIPPPLDLYDAKGVRHVHDDYRGKVTLVNFWASWCGPCIEEIPSLNRLREKMEGRPFELISVDYAEERDRILEFLADVDVDFPVLLDTDGTVSAKWNVLVFPSTFVIGPDGRIAYGVKGGIHWDAPETVATLKALMEKQ